MTVKPSKAIEVFYSYSHKDEVLRNKLETQLQLLEKQGHITGWHDRKIVPGKEWTSEIDTHLNTAGIILLLISPDYIASDYCYGTEMKKALERHETGEARVIPVILRPVDWRDAPFGRLYALPKQAKPVTTWSNRDAAFLDIAKGIRKAIIELATNLSTHSSYSDDTQIDLGKTSTFPSIWNVPYRRNPFFTDRDELLQSLRDTFKVVKTSSLLEPQAISGLGGIGKTQTAIEYAYRYHSDYRAVLWAKAESREILISDFVTLADLLNLPERYEQDQRKAVNAVKYWLKVNTDWLLILDNVEDVGMIVDFIPSQCREHVLLTTRTYAMGEVARRVKIDKLEPEVGALLLLRRAGVISLAAPLDAASRTDHTKAKEIAQAMDGLPLGIDQAGAYIEETNCGLSGYLELYQTQDAELLKRRGRLASSHPEPVATTWALSFQKMQQTNPAAADLLRLCAFLYPDTIPIEIITEGAPDLGPVLKSVATDLMKLDTVIEELLKFSLIRRDSKTRTLTIHRLVQIVLKDGMNEDMRYQWAERTVRAVNHAFPEVEFSNWDLCQRCLSHAQTCSALIEHWKMTFPEAAQLLHRVGNYFSQRARYQEAEPFLQQAIVIYEQIHGVKHPDVAGTLGSLGQIYTSQGKYAQAEPLLQRALTIFEEMSGHEHSDTADALESLGWLYRQQGRYVQAEPFYQQTLAIYEKMLEPQPKLMASSLNGLGGLYRDEGKYAQAEQLLHKAVAIQEKVLGQNHPELATTLNNIATLYDDQGKYIQGKAYLQRVVKIYERTVGPNHPLVAVGLSNLAENYRAAHNYGEAEKLQKRALSIREKVYGSEHLEVALSLNNLALVYHDQGRYSQAEPLYQRSLMIHEKALEVGHPFMARVLDNYAGLLRKTKRKAEAAKLEALAEGIRSKHAQEKPMYKIIEER